MRILKKLLIVFFSAFLFLCFSASLSNASDFIAPNSSGEPVIIDVSGLSLISQVEVSVGNSLNQPRPYRDENTKSLVIFPLPTTNSEQTIQTSAGNSVIAKTISFRSSPIGVLRNSLLPDLQRARGGNSVTKISDGRIVLAGGSKSLADSPIDTIEIFNPESGKSELLMTADGLKKASLEIPRSQHSATYIGINEKPIGMIVGPVEQILVVGGFSNDGIISKTIEIVEIKVGTSEGVSTLLTGNKSKLKKARIFHTASLMPDGRVLIIGGQGTISMTGAGALNSIEVFDPTTRLVLPSGITLNTPRLLHTSTILNDGNILIVGGFTNEKQDDFGAGPAVEKAELIDINNLSIRTVGSLINDEGLGGHSATLLTNGLVLITGGSTDFFSSSSGDKAKGLTKGSLQFYNTSNETFNVLKNDIGGNLELQFPRFLHQSVLLPNGSVAIVGGLSIKKGTSSSNLINTPISLVEVIEPNLLGFLGGELEARQKSSLESSVGRILPSVILVTPKNKTQGLLSDSDIDNLVNSAVYLTGGFTNGLGRLPTKVSELLQIESNNTIEGRNISLTPQAIVRGSFLSELLVKLDEFNKVPSLKVEPQTINLSSSNNFLNSIKVISTNNEVILLKAESNDPNGSIIVSPSLFQVGEEVSITRKDNSVSGEFEIGIIPADPIKDFIGAKVKVNVSDSSKPFLATDPGFGISLGTQTGDSSNKIKVKVLSQDGSVEFTSIPSGTEVTAMIADPTIANLGGTGISSVVGTLATQFTVNAVKPGNTAIDFSINFPDVLSVSVPVEVKGTPSFSITPVDIPVIANLATNGIELSNIERLDTTSVSFQDIRLSATSPLFPIYVPVNLQSSVDNSPIVGLFTIRPIFGVDLTTALPRTFVNKSETGFSTPVESVPLSIGGLIPSDPSINPIAVLSFGDGIRTIKYENSSSESITGTLTMISPLDKVQDVDLFEDSGSKRPKIVALKGAMIFVLDAENGNQENSISLTNDGFKQDLFTIDGQIASVISVGSKGIDLVFPLTDKEPRLVNFSLPGNTEEISVVEKLSNDKGPFVAAFDGNNGVSIVDLLDVNAQIKNISTAGEKISNIAYAGKFTVSGATTDVLVATSQRKISLFDLNKLTSIPINDDLDIKSKIEDLLVIDGIAYLALGKNGILAVSIGALIDSNDETDATIAHFKKNFLKVLKSNGSETIISKSLNASKLASSKPFLLSSGQNNNLTVIKVSP